MPIIQINVWTCEDCGLMVSTTEEVPTWYDPVVDLDGWEHRVSDDKLCCPKCLAKTT